MLFDLKLAFSLSSAPHMHAHALELLKNHLKEGMRALDIGSGSGYLTTCIAIMVGPRGSVIGVEHIPELVELSIKNVRKSHPDLLDSGRMKLYVGDGRSGFPESGPYDAIHVGAASNGLPSHLVDQLAPGDTLAPFSWPN